MRFAAVISLLLWTLNASAADFVDEATRMRFPAAISVTANEPAPATCDANTLALCRGPVQRYPDPRLGIGLSYSLGGNLALKLAGEYGESAPPQLRAVCAVSPVLELARCVEALERDMVQVRLTDAFRFVVVGAPSYLERYGVPQKPEDLLKTEVLIGATAPGSTTADFPAMTNGVLGSKMKGVEALSAEAGPAELPPPVAEFAIVDPLTRSGQEPSLAWRARSVSRTTCAGSRESKRSSLPSSSTAPLMRPSTTVAVITVGTSPGTSTTSAGVFRKSMSRPAP